MGEPQWSTFWKQSCIIFTLVPSWFTSPWCSANLRTLWTSSEDGKDGYQKVEDNMGLHRHLCSRDADVARAANILIARRNSMCLRWTPLAMKFQNVFFGQIFVNSNQRWPPHGPYLVELQREPRDFQWEVERCGSTNHVRVCFCSKRNILCCLQLNDGFVLGRQMQEN